MKIAEYLDKYKTPIRHFARQIGVAESTLRNILEGKYELKLATAYKIYEVTEGQVTLEEMLPEKNIKKRRKKT